MKEWLEIILKSTHLPSNTMEDLRSMIDMIGCMVSGFVPRQPNSERAIEGNEDEC